MKRILFLTQGGIHVSSSRHRVYYYLSALEKAGFDIAIHPAVKDEEFQQAFVSRSWSGHLCRALRTFSRRFQDLHHVRNFDYVFVQKPILPAPLFNMEARVARETRMIFDFDDAVFEKKPGGAFPVNFWSQAKRIASICRCAHKVVVGNENLANFARKAGVEPALLPTGIDMAAFDASPNLTKHVHKIPLIGWIGSHTTQPELEQILPSLIELHSRTPFVVRVIGGTQLAIPVRFPIEWKPWNFETEIQDVAHLDYGLAPLRDTPWNRGKCGLKILQYWAAGVPVVASPTGIQGKMIQDGENGLLAGPQEWTEKLLLLIKNPELRQKLIENGRKTVREKYSFQALAPRFLDLFREPGKEDPASSEA